MMRRGWGVQQGPEIITSCPISQNKEFVLDLDVKGEALKGLSKACHVECVRFKNKH